MRKTFIATAAAATLASGCAALAVAAGNPDEDRTPIEQCDTLPASASIKLLTNAETRMVCEEMLRILDGIVVADLREFSEAAAMLSVKGYKPGQEVEIVRELVEIIRLRGLAQNEPRWSPTVNLIWRLWIAEHGQISPRTVCEFLGSAGTKAARSMTDKALLDFMVIMAVSHKRGVGIDDAE
jgi:hypothetical protein